MNEREALLASFDAHYYAGQVNLEDSGGHELLNHYLNEGWRRGLSASLTLNTNFYLQANPDVSSSGLSPLEHFVSSGLEEGRLPNATLRDLIGDESPDLISALLQEFNTRYYLAKNPDVRALAQDPVSHYLVSGAAEGREPRPWFDSLFYLATYPECAEQSLNPFMHYLSVGRDKGYATESQLGFRRGFFEEAKKRDGDEQADIAVAGECPDLATLPSNLSSQANLVVSLSQDCYLDSVGGIQVCVRQEQQACAAMGLSYLHLASSEWPGVFEASLNGVRLGFVSLGDLIAACSGTQAILVVHSFHGYDLEDLHALLSAVSFSKRYLWLHDFYSLCPGSFLLKDGVQHCDAPPVSSETCSDCVYGAERIAHHQAMEALFVAAQFSILSPSQLALDYWTLKSNLAYSDTRVIPHVALTANSAAATRAPGPHRVAFIGVMAFHKGWPLFERLIWECMDSPLYEFYHFGRDSDSVLPLHWVYANTAENGEDSMVSALADAHIDLVVIPSLCQETFCLAACEALASGAQVLVLRGSGNAENIARESGRGMILAETELVSAFTSGRVAEWLDGIPTRQAMSMLPSGKAADAISHWLARQEK